MPPSCTTGDNRALIDANYDPFGKTRQVAYARHSEGLTLGEADHRFLTFGPYSELIADIAGMLVRCRTGLMQCSKQHRHFIELSARVSEAPPKLSQFWEQ